MHDHSCRRPIGPPIDTSLRSFQYSPIIFSVSPRLEKMVFTSSYSAKKPAFEFVPAATGGGGRKTATHATSQTDIAADCNRKNQRTGGCQSDGLPLRGHHACKLGDDRAGSIASSGHIVVQVPASSSTDRIPQGSPVADRANTSAVHNVGQITSRVDRD
jgi:hypothetical protein